MDAVGNQRCGLNGIAADSPARWHALRETNRARQEARIGNRAALPAARSLTVSARFVSGRGGVVHGATDDLGFHAVENRHYVTDLHQLGLDHQKLEVSGHKRLEIDFGQPIREILA